MKEGQFTITFIGDVMLGRIIGRKFENKEFQVVSPTLSEKISDSDLVIANLESPIPTKAKTDGDHMSFSGNKDILKQLKWIDVFNFSNNHINDCGSEGIDETINNLREMGFKYTGVYKDNYVPFKLHKKMELITFTDMLNIPFSKDCKWNTLRVQEETLNQIKKSHESGNIVILIAHIGMMFTRYPNPITIDYLHKCVDYGADLIVTSHSHCVGGMEYYKNTPIFYSLGDFVMDGNSFRRRRSVVLKIKFNNDKFTDWEIVPAEINSEYITTIPSVKISRKILNSFNSVTNNIKSKRDNYKSFYKWQYKIEMIYHTFSTLCFLYKHRGLLGLMKMISKRFEEVSRMSLWIIKDKSNDQRDDDAIKKDRKKFSQDELF